VRRDQVEDLCALSNRAVSHEGLPRVIMVSELEAYPEDDERTGRREAWIENLGTVGPWRGRGLASGLLAWSMRAFAAAGFSHAMIAVDSDNPTGAARLYRSLGFECERRSVTHQLEITV
jgi:mycothiol synthase